MSLLLLLSLPFIGSLVAAKLPTSARNVGSLWGAAVALAVAVQLAWLYPAVSAGQRISLGIDPAHVIVLKD